jgi:hypothetical protein
VNAGASSRASTRSVTSPSRSSASSSANLDRVLAQFEKLTEPLLAVFNKQALAAPVLDGAQKAAAESEHKMRLVTSLAAQIQAFSSVQKSAEGDNIDKVKKKMTDLTTEMLQL